MSRLEDLIRELCPNGVEFKTIKEVTKEISTGLNPRRNFQLNLPEATLNYVTVKEFTTGKIVFSDKTDKITKDAWKIIQTRSNLETGDVLLSGIGTIGKVALVDIPVDNWNCSESVILLKPKQDLIIPKFLMYILGSDSVQQHLNKKATGSTLKGIRQKDLVALQIPVPPLEVQQEIARILDKFATLEAELEAELEARRKQHIFYREKLFEFNENVEFKSLAEICTALPKGTLKTAQLTESGYPVVNSGRDFYGYYPHFNNEGNAFTFASRGENAGFVAYLKEKFWAGGLCYPYRSKNEDVYLTKFIYYYLKSKEADNITRLVERGSIPALNKADVNDIPIPVPPLAEQKRIVEILDKFSTLIDDISSGLPAEIKMRHQQYEYYRDKLLTFKQAA